MRSEHASWSAAPTRGGAEAAEETAPAITVRGLTKTYASGLTALHGIDLDIHRGELLALLGPNGAGKTTLISIICGLVNPSGGEVRVEGHEIVRDYRRARRLIGLVPQELATEAFETVQNTVRFSRGLFGLPQDPEHTEAVLRDLSLWDKRDEPIKNLSGGMKRRVMIAKALVHEPRILFLDEPTAGVDVELRREMWALVHRLREQGVTIILTTHYIEEAEAMADRVGVIHRGELMVVDETRELMRKLGVKDLVLHLAEPLEELPPMLRDRGLWLEEDGRLLVYSYDPRHAESGIAGLLQELLREGIHFQDLETRQSSLEEIFVNLVRDEEA